MNLFAMIQFEREMRMQSARCSTSLPYRLFVVVACFAMFGGCKTKDPKESETQILIAKGNQKMGEMKASERDLQDVGLYLIDKNKTELYLPFRSEKQLVEMKRILKAFIQTSEEVLKIAAEPSVSLYDREGIQEKFTIANNYLQQIEAELKAISERRAL